MTMRRERTGGSESLADLINTRGNDGMTLEQELLSLGELPPDTVLTVSIDLTGRTGYGARLTRRLRGGIDWKGLIEWAEDVLHEGGGCLWQSITIQARHQANRG